MNIYPLRPKNWFLKQAKNLGFNDRKNFPIGLKNYFSVAISICFLLSTSLFSAQEKEELMHRVETHCLLEDFYSALKEAEKGIEQYPDSIEINKIYLRVLALAGYEVQSISKINSLSGSLKDLRKDHQLLEEISWSILKKGLNSTQYSTRLASMLGIYFTKDARAVKVLNSMMCDSNAILRSVAVQLAISYKDDILKESLSRLLDHEKVWLVRLEVLKAIGQMKIVEKAESLKEILKNEKATFEERALAIKSLVEIYENIDLTELELLLDSPFAGFRSLGCELATNFKIVEVKEKIYKLLFDPRCDVRISALNAIVLYYKDHLNKEKLATALDQVCQDANSFVAITGSWAALTMEHEKGNYYLKKWFFDKYGENRRFAAAALAQAGVNGIKLSEEILEQSNDPFVKANLAIGLIGQRRDVKSCSDVLYDLIKNKKGMWMWESGQNSLFKILSPSEVRHTDQLPNYPEAIDQSVQLKLLSLLAVLEDPRAQEGIKTFLKRKTWGITGLAAISLLQEGDEDSLNVLKSLLTDKEKNVRIQAALALALIGKDRSSLPVLEEAYFSADYDLKLNILGAIGQVSNQGSIPFLIKVLSEPFEILRIAAAAAIIQATNL
jgi:HEAT repeat protein